MCIVNKRTSRVRLCFYNALSMLTPVIADMKRMIGFTDQDAQRVKELAEHCLPQADSIIRRLHCAITEDPDARAVFREDDKRIDDHRQPLTAWFRSLFDGVYDDAYFEQRLHIGTKHAQVGLRQDFMVVGVSLIWRETERRVRQLGFGDVDDALSSFHKLLMLDLGAMLYAYKEGYTENVRQSERSAFEAKLTRAEHLAEIGQLAASLAHEIKNPLAGISGAIQVIRDTMADEDPHQPILREVLGQIKRLDETVKDLLTYARPTPPRWRRFPAGRAVKHVLGVLRQEPALQAVDVAYTSTADDVLLMADEHQVEQLLMNLILNAGQASPAGEVVRVTLEADSESVRFAVIDNGAGMTPMVRHDAFEPFYTTKAKGTGLGLPICRRIVDVHGGRISLTSAAGRGTTVNVALPRCQDSEAPETST